MFLNINIPTRGRPEKLKECLKSIDYTGAYKVFIHCYDEHADLPDVLPGHPYEIIEDKEILTIASHNAVCKRPGHFLGLSDDIVFHPGAINEAVVEVEGLHLSDGIVDFTVANMNAPDGCYMLLGDKFIMKFPDRTPYCPYYKFMFASAELRDYAKSIDAFTKCAEAKLDHFHPAVTGKPDETHQRIRSSNIIHDDQVLYNRRKAQGLIWGHK